MTMKTLIEYGLSDRRTVARGHEFIIFIAKKSTEFYKKGILIPID